MRTEHWLAASRSSASRAPPIQRRCHSRSVQDQRRHKRRSYWLSFAPTKITPHRHRWARRAKQKATKCNSVAVRERYDPDTRNYLGSKPISWPFTATNHAPTQFVLAQFLIAQTMHRHFCRLAFTRPRHPGSMISGAEWPLGKPSVEFLRTRLP